MNGWIKLHRAMTEWEWYDDANTVRLFLHLILTATHKPTKYRGHSLAPGDVVYGHNAYADQLNLSVQSIRTALNKLKSTDEVTVKITSKFSIVSLACWDKYQVEQQAEQQATNKQSTSKQQATNTIQECKKVIREERTIGDGKKGTRELPDDWQPNGKAYEVGSGEGYTHDEVTFLGDGFADHAKANGRRQKNWDSSFYNWLRSDISRRSIDGRRNSGQRNAGNDSFAAITLRVADRMRGG